MKAQIKINYSEATKGQIFEIIEIQGKRVTLNINGRSVDFGFSEVQIVAPRKSDLFNLGRCLMNLQTFGFCMRNEDIKKAINTINLPIKNTLANKAFYEFIYS